MRCLPCALAARFPAVGWCLVLLIVVTTGCGYPVAQPENMELISSLRTALSARNEEWLQANEEIIQQRREQGAMRDDEFNAFRAIVDQARAGDWASAERAAVAFQRSQRPTEEQIRRLREKRK